MNKSSSPGGFHAAPGGSEPIGHAGGADPDDRPAEVLGAAGVEPHASEAAAASPGGVGALAGLAGLARARLAAGAPAARGPGHGPAPGAAPGLAADVPAGARARAPASGRREHAVPGE